MVATIEWQHRPRSHIRLIDQTALPTQELCIEISTVDHKVDAINCLDG
jgi:methylthioribose-1-phosphate isomerase